MLRRSLRAVAPLGDTGVGEYPLVLLIDQFDLGREQSRAVHMTKTVKQALPLMLGFGEGAQAQDPEEPAGAPG